MKRLSLIVIVLISTFSFAEEESREMEIIRIVVASDGYLTKSIYDEFWSEVVRNPRSEELMNHLKVMTYDVQYLQKEIWSAAKKSAELGVIYGMTDLEQLIADNSKRTKDTMRAKMTDREYKAFMQGYSGAEENSRLQTYRVLNAAANKSTLSLNGTTIEINMDLINTVLQGIESSFYRVSNLLDPDFIPSEKLNNADCLKISNDLNQSNPAVIDKETTLISTTCTHGSNILYLFELKKTLNQKIPQHRLAELRNKVLNSLCTSPDQNDFLKILDSMAYRYISQTGYFMGEFEIVDSDCR